jgi:ABC-2 type transport system permease protein
VGPLLPLTVANIRSFIRDRAALFWTIAFPVIFVVLFGTLFGGAGNATYQVGWVDLDASPASAALKGAFSGTGLLSLSVTDRDAGIAAAQDGHLDAVIVVPQGYGAGVAAAQGTTQGSTGTVAIELYIDPTHTSTATALDQIVAGVTTQVNQQLSGRPPVVTVQTRSIQGTASLNGASYFVPSILAMAIMQLGVFAAVPLVQQREKLILKRLGATPLPRATLVGSNVLLRLVIAAGQTAIIIGVGIGFLGVQVTGSWVEIVVIIALGALAFTALGYVIASFARTEEAANGITQVVQLPMMFLSGIFFPIVLMPDWLQSVAKVLPLTYFADALRQTMVGGSPFVPLALCFAVLLGWLVACLAISARFFRWQ